MIPIAKPYVSSDEKKNINIAINDGWISSRGKFIPKFESELKFFFKIKYCTTCSNGTSALMLALRALNINPGDEIIVPDLSFAATINAVINVGATPVICEINKNHWCIDAEKIENRISKRTRAIIVVHLYGQSCEMNKILKISKRHKLYVIEDSAEAFGSKYREKYLGTIGDIGCFSFYGNKTIATGEGCCCITNNKKFFDKILLLKNQGMTDKKRYYHFLPGYNFRMTNLQAAIGLAQLKKIKKFFFKRKFIESYYFKNLKNLPFFKPQQAVKNTTKINWLYTALFKVKNLNKFIKILKKNNIDSRNVFYPFHMIKIYKSYVPKNFNNKNSNLIFKYGLSLPTFYELKKNQLSKIVQVIKKYRD